MSMELWKRIYIISNYQTWSSYDSTDMISSAVKNTHPYKDKGLSPVILAIKDGTRSRGLSSPIIHTHKTNENNLTYRKVMIPSYTVFGIPYARSCYTIPDTKFFLIDHHHFPGVPIVFNDHVVAKIDALRIHMLFRNLFRAKRYLAMDMLKYTFERAEELYELNGW